MSQPVAPVVHVADSQDVNDIFTAFCSASSSPKTVQDAVHALTRHIVSAAVEFDTTLTHTTLIPVLRGGLPMYVAAQPLFTSASCVLVRCSKAKGSDSVVVDWSGRCPFPQAPGDGRLVVLDTVIATGDTVARLCDELWETSGRRKNSVVVMCCYAAPAALDRLARHPVVQYVVVARRAEGCDEAGYLVPPTHGDIGDKLFGEKDETAAVALFPSVSDGQDAALVLRGVEGLLEQNGGAWRLSCDGTAIERRVRFKKFKTAMEFMRDIAQEADKRSHHPEWSNVYTEVTIRWTTHYPRGLSQRDVDCAKMTDEKYKMKITNIEE